MVLSHRHKFIYTKTIKTASTSVEAFFAPYCVPEGTTLDGNFQTLVSDAGILAYNGKNALKVSPDWFHHMTAEQIRRQLEPEVWRDYFKFCVIRNPYDKLVSRFHYAMRADNRDHHNRWWRRAYSKIQTNLATTHPVYRLATPRVFRYWVRRHARPIDRSIYMIDGKSAMDYYIRYEELDTGVEEVCRRLDLPFEPGSVPRLNTKSRPKGVPLTSYYDEATVAIVKERFDFEIKTFGYRSPLETADA